MSTKKRKLTDIQILAICHFVGVILISFYGQQVYELAKIFPNVLGKLFLSTNHSIWEQSKMLVVPLSIIFIVEYFIVGKKFKNFIPAHIMVAFALPVIMVVFNFVYESIFGTLSMEGAQSVYFLTLVLAAFLASILLVTSENNLSKYLIPFLILYILLCASYAVFSFMPPKIKIFYDSTNQVFGPIY